MRELWEAGHYQIDSFGRPPVKTLFDNVKGLLVQSTNISYNAIVSSRKLVNC